MIEMDARVEKRLSAENSVLNINPLFKNSRLWMVYKTPIPGINIIDVRESDNVIGNWSLALLYSCISQCPDFTSRIHERKQLSLFLLS